MTGLADVNAKLLIAAFVIVAVSCNAEFTVQARKYKCKPAGVSVFEFAVFFRSTLTAS